MGAPDTFECSATSINDFLLLLKDDASPAITLLFKELVDELDRQEFLSLVRRLNAVIVFFTLIYISLLASV